MTTFVESAEPVVGDDIAAIDTLRRGLRRTPVLRAGLAWSVAFGLLWAGGRLAIPILVQLIIDRGFDDGFDRGYVYTASGVTLGIVLVVTTSALVAKLRMIRAAEQALFDLRVQGFRRVHDLSLADHNEQRRGELVSRVTSDVDTIARFLDWGALSWIIDLTLMVGVFVVMAFYSWQLTLVVLVLILVVLPVLRFLQRRQVRAYDLVRTRVGEVLGLTSETLGGAETVRSYGVADRMEGRLDVAIENEYHARMEAARYFSVLFAISDIYNAVTLVAVTVTLYVWGGSWGLSTGEIVAFLLLLGLLQIPLADLTEVLDQTQTALAGWHKVLVLLDREPAVTEPSNGAALPTGALTIDLRHVSFDYDDGVTVLDDVDVHISAAADVAIVGETGSGKTTFARLLVRLADPVSGVVELGGVDLSTVDADARRSAVRMVPQDGFLFDTTVRRNIGYGRAGADDAEVEAVVDSLGLRDWVATLPDGLDTEVGERGERLSVGERQLVALARAALADPGLLVLDEATSSVDPETEQVLASALEQLSVGRTTVAIAHRLSTAERAELVLVFDGGRLVEQGTHATLVGAGGRYAELYRSWELTTGTI
ncbi:MAG: ABC transporter ATP-binding protein/permease [Acidimicrobiia bacterium]|nr:ABC transporter ATP-binding protein/permease [Acidimicrobiia bacterium]